MEKTIKKGETLFHSFDKIKNLYYIEKGIGKISILNQRDKELISHLGQKGELLGLLQYLNGKETYDVSFIAITDMEILCIPILDYEKHLQELEINIQELLLKKAQYFRIKNDQIDVTSKVKWLLLYLDDFYNHGETKGNFINKITMEDMAALIGITRESLSREFTKLREFGYLEITNQNYTYSRNKMR